MLLNKKARVTKAAFTLVEMMVVITIMGVIASMLLVAIPGVTAKREKAKISTELERLVTAIEAYKAKYGTYPPDTASPTNNTLYYELAGAEILVPTPTQPNYAFRSQVDGRVLDATVFKNIFGLDGIMNVKSGPTESKKFIDLRSDQWTTLTNVVTGAPYSVLKVPSRAAPGFALTNFGQVVVPWSYNAANPIHNPGKFDLSATFLVGKDVFTIGNWKN